MERESAEAPRAAGSLALHPAPEVADCVARGCDVWIFGYGSLMWDPGFAFVEARPALLRGYHRSFCVYSYRYRGTAERPGLVLGLDRGGACKGIAYRVPRRHRKATMLYLWDREIRGGVYDMKKLRVRLPRRTVEAYAFVVDREHRGYAAELSVKETARHILQGAGRRGLCVHYLENTVRHIEALGLTDGPLHRLAAIVERMAAR
jgi:cation transport protein ChaC